MGRLSPEKGTHRLLSIWSRLAADYPDWKLAIAGDGPLLSWVREQVDGEALRHQVECLGWQSNPTSVLAVADAFVLPSHYEGFPSALIEAMYAGIPSVATDCSEAIGELIDHGVNGLMAANDESSLEAELRRLLDDPCLRESFARKTHQSASRFTWSQIGPRWLRLLDELSG